MTDRLTAELGAPAQGLFDYLIATDDVHGTATAAAEAAAAAEEGEESGAKKKKRRKKEAASVVQDKRRGPPRKDEEFGVTRGIDFKGVKTIINFDLPTSVEVSISHGMILSPLACTQRRQNVTPRLRSVALKCHLLPVLSVVETWRYATSDPYLPALDCHLQPVRSSVQD